LVEFSRVCAPAAAAHEQQEAPHVSKLSDYLTKHKIDPRRVIAASNDLEAMRPEDRKIKLARLNAKGGDESAKELAAQKRRSGRPLSRPAIARALAGGTVTRKTRGRIVRAVNAVLAHKSKGEAKAADLF
jgi:hypothetical protein